MTNTLPMQQAPVADRRPHSFTHHGITIEDPYHWLKDPGYPNVTDEDVLAYLRAENAYFDTHMSRCKGLVEELFEEIKARQKQEDASVPAQEGDYFYQWAFRHGEQYRIWKRWPVDAPDQAEVILDGPALAEGHEHFSLGALAISPNGRFAAYSVDTSGAERYQLRIKDLQTGDLFPEVIENSQGSPEWSSDSTTLFYTLLNDNWRPYQVRRHRLGTAVEDDATLYDEADEGFFVHLGKTSSQEFIVIASSDHVTSEVHLLPAGAPSAPLRLVSARREKHEYEIDHQGDRFVILTNDQHKNFRLATASTDNPGEANWQTLVAGSDEHFLRGLQCFKSWIVVEERINGLDQIRIIDRNAQSHYIEFGESSFVVHLGTNRLFDAPIVRLAYSSLVTPATVYDYVVADDTLVTRKVQEIPSGYDASEYRSRRVNAPARDGISVPVSLLFHKDTPLDGSAPLLLYGYGAYGHAISPSFSPTRLSLVDRGFVFAIAHVRGGDDLGYHWYEDGKLDKRTNTFNDFVDVARYLVAEHYVQPRRIVIQGGSAGGELMGAVVNQAPELWGAVVANVPFVDVLNTMLDTSLPLTPMEWPEWGNPIEDKAAFELIRSYSPYDQLVAGHYPAMMVTAGMNDPRVTYWEPAKYVAKLRSLKTDDAPLVLKTNMGAGHGGKSGRFRALYEAAEEYAFMIDAIEG